MSTKLKLLIGLNAFLLISVLTIQIYQINIHNESVHIDFPNVALDSALIPDKFVVNQQVIIQKNNEWYIQDTISVQPEAVISLWGMLRKLAVSRQVGEIQTAPSENMIKVEVWKGNDILASYIFLPNEDNTESYLQWEDKIYVAYVTGSEGNIYEFLSHVEPLQWRSRRLFRTNWQTLTSLEVRYQDDEANSYHIKRNGSFFAISGVSQLDSAKLYYYLLDIERFNIGKYLTENRLRDSLKVCKPLCTILLEDTNTEKNNIVCIYPYQERLIGILDKTNELVGFNSNALKKILVNKGYFEAKQ